MTQHAIILFTRTPVPGQVKTRLMPAYSGEECAALQHAMAADAVDALRPLGLDILLFYSQDGPPESLRGIGDDLLHLPQCGPDLGARMDQATCQALTAGYERVLLLGSDLPFLSHGDVAPCSALLEGHDVVLAPSEDGGYWLVGLKQAFSPLFTHQHYGTGQVLEDARSVCRVHQKTLALGPMRRDLDTPEDLRYFATQYPNPTACRTSRLLAQYVQRLQV